MVRRQFPKAEVILNTSNLGFAAANNRALRLYAGRARYFLLLNPDTVVGPGTIDQILAYVDLNPEVGISGCKLVKPDGTLYWPCKR
jgi:GT2 family glycosyltransferase